MTEYVCTRWYRAPEVLCGWAAYSFEVDVWSVGCCLLELATREQLLKGASTADQLQKVVKVVGTPSGATVAKMPSEKARYMLRSLGAESGLADFGVDAKRCPGAAALLARMLCFDADARACCKELLTDPFLAKYADPLDEPEAKPLDPSLFEFERRRVGTLELEEEGWRELLCYHAASGLQADPAYDPTRCPLEHAPEEERGEDEPQPSLGRDVRLE